MCWPVSAGRSSATCPAFDAACIAAYVCGKAGESVAMEKGAGMLASDLVDKIPAVLFRKGA